MHTNWQVCSLVVQAKSERISDISTNLNAFTGCEVAVSDAPSGQLIVVVEAEDSETLIQTIESSTQRRGACWRCRWFITSRKSKVRKHHETQSS